MGAVVGCTKQCGPSFNCPIPYLLCDPRLMESVIPIQHRLHFLSLEIPTTSARTQSDAIHGVPTASTLESARVPGVRQPDQKHLSIATANDALYQVVGNKVPHFLYDVFVLLTRLLMHLEESFCRPVFLSSRGSEVRGAIPYGSEQRLNPRTGLFRTYTRYPSYAGSYPDPA